MTSEFHTEKIELACLLLMNSSAGRTKRASALATGVTKGTRRGRNRTGCSMLVSPHRSPRRGRRQRRGKGAGCSGGFPLRRQERDWFEASAGLLAVKGAVWLEEGGWRCAAGRGAVSLLPPRRPRGLRRRSRSGIFLAAGCRGPRAQPPSPAPAAGSGCGGGGGAVAAFGPGVPGAELEPAPARGARTHAMKGRRGGQKGDGEEEAASFPAIGVARLRPDNWH